MFLVDTVTLSERRRRHRDQRERHRDACRLIAVGLFWRMTSRLEGQRPIGG